MNFEKDEALLKESKNIYYFKEIVSLSLKLTVHIYLLFKVNTNVKFRIFNEIHLSMLKKREYFQLLSSQSQCLKAKEIFYRMSSVYSHFSFIIPYYEKQLNFIQGNKV